MKGRAVQDTMERRAPSPLQQQRKTSRLERVKKLALSFVDLFHQKPSVTSLTDFEPTIRRVATFSEREHKSGL
jgi:hypothetical protein